LRGHLETQGATSLRLHCSPYFVNSAFYPIIDNVKLGFPGIALSTISACQYVDIAV
jgi:hypothetical protein